MIGEGWLEIFGFIFEVIEMFKLVDGGINLFIVV